jgi:transketolase
LGGTIHNQEIKTMPTRKMLANAIRFLAIDAVQKANSGHPGMPMGMADIAEVLWNDFIHVNPGNPHWFNRDRFVLSNGHGAMLLYSLLHLTGFELSIDDLKHFRQLHSKTPGHPEYSEAPGVETTTGPLGQGLANAVGMALAEKMLGSQFNDDEFKLVNHYTYTFVGDGCLMEGISHEVCSLAGTWGLGKLIVFYDDNGISIDGDVRGWFTDNTPQRFEAYGWQVLPNVNGHDPEAIKNAIIAAQEETEKPTIICCKTVIGFGSPTLAGSEKTHGAPLGDAEIVKTREKLGWNHPAFVVPAEIYAAWDKRQSGGELEQSWNNIFAKYERKHPEKAAEFLRRTKGYLPENFALLTQKLVEAAKQDNKEMATRKASLSCLNIYGPALPELLGGSADLSESNCTHWSGAHLLSRENPAGNYIEYGVREFGMAAIMNGLSLHGGFIPYGGTFLTFADYARNAVRLSALMKQRVIYVFTHDSIGLGEDGPTHQPIEHASMLRLTPGLNVWRPADLYETVVAWDHALQQRGPSALLLTRQNLPALNSVRKSTENVENGAYVLAEFGTENDPVEGIFIATGSEVHLALEAAAQLHAEENIKIRVVSMPCADIFKKQPKEYQDDIIPRSVKARVAIEAGTSDFWYQFVGDYGRVIGINQFGYSAPAQEVYKELGLTTENLKKTLLSLLSRVV